MDRRDDGVLLEEDEDDEAQSKFSICFIVCIILTYMFLSGRDAGCLEEEEEEEEGERERENGEAQGTGENGGNNLDEDPEQEDEDEEGPGSANLEEQQITLEFIELVKHAKLDDSKLDPEVIHRLRNPVEAPLEIGDPDKLLSMKLFSATARSSQVTYTEVREAILERHPDNPILSYELAKKAVQESSGVVSIMEDMCPKGCLGYTGPFSHLEKCPRCGTDRYDPIILLQSKGKKKVPQQQFCTIPPGPMLQALERTEEGSKNMGHFWRHASQIMAMLIHKLGKCWLRIMMILIVGQK